MFIFPLQFPACEASTGIFTRTAVSRLSQVGAEAWTCSNESRLHQQLSRGKIDIHIPLPCKSSLLMITEELNKITKVAPFYYELGF